MTARAPAGNARRATRMANIERAIQMRKARITRDWQRIGRYLAEVRRKALWLIGDWRTFEEWLAHVGISQSLAYDLMAIHDSAHRDLLEQMEVSTARLALPHMRDATRAEAEAIADEMEAHPRLSDRRMALNGEREFPPVAVECPSCHARLLANRAVILQKGGRAHGRQNQKQSAQEHHSQRVA